MKAELVDLIKKIHDSNLFGIVCETGCGQPLAQALYSVSGASKTIYFSESPYSKDYQDKKFGKDDNRAVSLEKIRHILTHYVSNNPECNFYYVSSFQVGDETNKISTHGWIGFYTMDSIRYYHVSIFEALPREQYFDKIAEIGLNLLAGNSADHIDCAHISEIRQDLGLTLEHHLNSKNDENIIWIKDGKILRFENLLRETENLFLYKGSFNPPHIAHQEVATVTKNVYGVNPLFCISTKTYGKVDMTSKDLHKRVVMLNSLGYDVIISKKPMFRDIVDYIRLKYQGKITLLMGSDTFDRYLDTTPEELPVDYVVFQRPGMLLNHEPHVYAHLSHKLTILPEYAEISSTEIRNTLSSDLTREEKIQKLKQYLDPTIIKQLL